MPRREIEIVVARELEDLPEVRRAVRAASRETGMSELDQTRVGTAASEIARNMVLHGGGGQVTLEAVEERGALEPRSGLRLVFEDRGPGIADLGAASADGFSSGRGLGLGLGGARRLMDEMEVETRAGRGTRIVLVKWLPPAARPAS